MQLLTRRFIQDILVIILTGSLFYILIHNPITHPTLKVSKGYFSIQLMQQPLVFGIAGHNYLVLRDSNNQIKEELHGLATDTITGSWKYIGNDTTDVLKVWKFAGPHFYIAQKNYSGVTLSYGDEKTITTIWQKAIPCVSEINNLQIKYPPYGMNIRGDTENSNSVAYTLTRCMGLDAEHLGLITPGWGKNLLDSR